MTAAKNPTKKRVRKSRAKADTAPKPSAVTTPEFADPAPTGVVIEEKWEAPARVAKNADAHTKTTKRQQAIVLVVLSQAACNLQDLPDDDGELQQVGVAYKNGTGKLVPYNEIVQAFVDQAPHLAESIKVTDQR